MIGSSSAKLLIELASNPTQLIVSRKQAQDFYGSRLDDKLFNGLINCLKTFDITTPNRIRHFFAQTAHESGQLQWMAEIADGSAYEGRRDLGNIYPGDGRKFKGVGPIQVTGRNNYQAFANAVNDPRVMEGWQYVMSAYTFEPSGFWWKMNRVNQMIDAGASVEKVSRQVNRGGSKGTINGLAERVRYYNQALKIIA
jgi:putative chitinase